MNIKIFYAETDVDGPILFIQKNNFDRKPVREYLVKPYEQTIHRDKWLVCAALKAVFPGATIEVT